MADYTYFMFDDISSSKYNLYIQNNGEDLSYPSQPGFDNQIVSPLFQGVNFLAGVNKTARQFNFNCWADSLNRDSVKAMLEWLSPDKIGQLVLDYNPNYYYNVKLNSLTDFKHMAINEDGTANYEFQLSFITIEDFAAISRTDFVINAKTNPLNSDDTVFLNPDNLAPIGVWDAATSKFKIFNYASEPLYPTILANDSLTALIKKNGVTHYDYANSAAQDFIFEGQFGFAKIGTQLAEAVANTTATTNLGSLEIASGNSQILYTTLNTTYVAPTVVLKYTDDILTYADNESNLYMIIQDGDYGTELLTQTMTEEERQNYITQAINEQYNKINRDGSNSNIDKLTFNINTLDTSALLEGEVRWNSIDNTLDIGMDGDGVVQQVGMETFYPKCRNNDIVTIPDGALVMYDGAQGNSGVLLVKRATTTMSLPGLAMGIATEAIPVNGEGRITWFGLVRGIQTNGANYGETWTDGTVLYNGATAGAFSKVKPVAPRSAVMVGVVVNANPSNGIIFVRPQYFPFLGHLSDVSITTPVDGDILVYNGSLGRWENNNRLSIPRWTDLNFPFQRTMLGALGKPDFDYTNIGLLFPQNDISEIVYITVQMPHGWKEGTDINPHIHCVQKANQAVRFDMQYKWYNVGDAEPVGWTTHTMNQYAISYVSGNLSQIVQGSTMISGTGKKISSILKIKLFRNDNTYTGDFFADQFDIHYQVDAYGSASEYIK